MNRSGFWSGMPQGMKGRLFAWVIYFAIAIFVFFGNPILGAVLLVLPVFWFIIKNWVLAEFLVKTDLHRKETILGYTTQFLWGKTPPLVRGALTFVWVSAVLGALVWVSTEDMREALAKPSLTDRTIAATEGAIDATKEKTGGWVQTAKGWFTSDPEN